ncbi:hypothetical protein EBZ37_02780 [bacterium]|nr:hypothetical protein [bacterium]
MWGYRWIYASLPAQVFLGMISASLGLTLGGPVWAAAFACVSVIVVTGVWIGLGLLSSRAIEEFWDAKPNTLLERTWFRSFDEVGISPARAPLFFISSELAPIFLLWSEGPGRRSIIVSRSWLSAHTEPQIREAFRLAASRWQDGGLRWRTAHAWFVATLVRRLPEGVRAALWRESGGSGSTVFQWVLSLPGVAWLLWVQRVFLGDHGAPSREGYPKGPLAPVPTDAARRAAVALMSVEPSDREKTILSFCCSS